MTDEILRCVHTVEAERPSRKALYENYIDAAIPVVTAPCCRNILADFSIREEPRSGVDVGVGGQLVIGMEFGHSSGVASRTAPSSAASIQMTLGDAQGIS
jgi:hypothetical protein